MFSSKQASKQQASSTTREMAKNQISLVVLPIRVKFRWMIPMGVRYNHTTVAARNAIPNWRTSI